MITKERGGGVDIKTQLGQNRDGSFTWARFEQIRTLSDPLDCVGSPQSTCGDGPFFTLSRVGAQGSGEGKDECIRRTGWCRAIHFARSTASLCGFGVLGDVSCSHESAQVKTHSCGMQPQGFGKLRGCGIHSIGGSIIYCSQNPTAG